MSHITIVAIQQSTAHVFGVPVMEMTTARRALAVTRPRQVAMFLARELTPRSLPEIGRAFGGRDHTTVMHAIARIGDLVSSDPDLAANVARAREQVLGLSTGEAASLKDFEVPRLDGPLAERDAEITKLAACISRLTARIAAQDAEIAALRAGAKTSPRARACLKCRQPIVSRYPALCDRCRHENRHVSPLAEGIVA
ncbi:helix-turn-helix domain-containing protein [Shumkonia mesophila]|uniref:helix-turn-helix domain-containing protein n=1 Tax=Shumkonia mesophila TaxID=2838854 RepID=UPI002934C87A|nr:helix-turn-helix domain-containing protein [Shumkonia mesophila]